MNSYLVFVLWGFFKTMIFYTSKDSRSLLTRNSESRVYNGVISELTMWPVLGMKTLLQSPLKIKLFEETDGPSHLSQREKRVFAHELAGLIDRALN